jgi:signal transduction histidine kinase
MLSISLLILYLKDQNKSKSLHAFFGTLTHELKTPLASIKLQSEVIYETLFEKNDQYINNLLIRLIEDTSKLEIQMDKILQLSRIERGGNLNLVPVNIIPFIKNIAKSWSSYFLTEISCTEENLNILADEFAIELIIKNLFENTRIHTQSKTIKIDISKTEKIITIKYQDEGKFDGKFTDLGTLFYKHNSSKGSGIGLYLINQLMLKMKGSLTITKNSNSTNEIIHILKFLSDEDANA